MRDKNTAPPRAGMHSYKFYLKCVECVIICVCARSLGFGSAVRALVYVTHNIYHEQRNQPSLIRRFTTDFHETKQNRTAEEGRFREVSLELRTTGGDCRNLVQVGGSCLLFFGFLSGVEPAWAVRAGPFILCMCINTLWPYLRRT